MSVSVENFLKAIYKTEKAAGVAPKIGVLSSRLGISNAATTDMARKLAAKKLVLYTKYKPIHLTNEGKKYALNVIRKHRLWESFLYKYFSMDLHEIHREAEMLEHQTSDFLADRLSTILNHPQFDPHGDPIPNKTGKLPQDRKLIRLSESTPGSFYRVVRILDDTKTFIRYCKTKTLLIKTELKVKEIIPELDIIELQIAGTELSINSGIANKILIEEIN